MCPAVHHAFESLPSSLAVGNSLSEGSLLRGSLARPVVEWKGQLLFVYDGPRPPRGASQGRYPFLQPEILNFLNPKALNPKPLIPNPQSLMVAVTVTRLA